MAAPRFPEARPKPLINRVCAIAAVDVATLPTRLMLPSLAPGRRLPGLVSLPRLGPAGVPLASVAGRRMGCLLPSSPRPRRLHPCSRAVAQADAGRRVPTRRRRVLTRVIPGFCLAPGHAIRPGGRLPAARPPVRHPRLRGMPGPSPGLTASPAARPVARVPRDRVAYEEGFNLFSRPMQARQCCRQRWPIVIRCSLTQA